jgi:hypothetical protein
MSIRAFIFHVSRFRGRLFWGAAGAEVERETYGVVTNLATNTFFLNGRLSKPSTRAA